MIEGRACPSIDDASITVKSGLEIEGHARPSIYDARAVARGARDRERPARQEGPMPRISKAVKLAKAKSLLGGVSKHLRERATLRMGGDHYSPNDLIALFRSHMEAIDAVDAAGTAFSSQ